ncbi:Arc family DNA-binding protein [Mesorhizobium sp. WSM3626]|nr:Arc family DNA-binding protein [Mesorhizobium sp. WSM3626]
MDIKDMKIRVPAELKQKLTDRANRNDRTINGEVLQILKTALSAKHPKAA